MKINNEKLKRIGMLLLFVIILAGCAVERTDGGAIAKPITLDSPWSFSEGWFDFLFVIPVAKIMLWVGENTHIVFGIMMGTVVVNLITLPIMIKSTISSQKMQLIQPEMKKIQDKYKGRKDTASQTRMSVELRELYKKNDVSMGLSMVLPFMTFPIMIAMWHSVQRIEAYFTTFLGMDLLKTPLEMLEKIDVRYVILVALVGITQYLSTELNNYYGKKYNPKYKAPVGMMKNMNVIFTGMILMMAFTMSTAMSFYWITTSLFAIARTVFIQYKYMIPAYKSLEKTSYLDKGKK